MTHGPAALGDRTFRLLEKEETTTMITLKSYLRGGFVSISKA